MENATPQPSVLKWGEAAKGGFQMIPDILLKKQKELGLNATELLVLINVTMHWWYPDQRPFPRPATIAARMDVDVRTVQRAFRKLEEQGLMRRAKDKLANGNERDVCDLSGLLAQLERHVRTDTSYLARQAAAVPSATWEMHL